MVRDFTSIWRTARRIDPTLAVRESDAPLLRTRRVLPEPYSRERLFSRMAAGEPVLFSDFGVEVAGPPALAVRDRLLALYRRGLRSQVVRVQTGPSQRRARISVPELLRRWDRGRAVVSVTDLHIRGTRVEAGIGVDALSDFNLLLLGSDDMAIQEMMTLVISTAGNVTDSHSDDPDGSNHCFTGTKLWLAWDTFEGMERGLNDHSREDLDGYARFDIRTFLSLASARWWLVSAGETLFLPGKLTHKVLTLDHYLGIGSFYVAMPSCLETLSRWYARGPLWSLKTDENAGLVDEIARTVTRKVRAVRHASEAQRARWGLAHLEDAVARFQREPAAVREPLMRHPAFAELVGTVARTRERAGEMVSAAS